MHSQHRKVARQIHRHGTRRQLPAQREGYNVAVVDCDDPQHSIHGLREHETALIGRSIYFKALACDHFRKIKKNAYPVIKSNAVNALDDAEG